MTKKLRVTAFAIFLAGNMVLFQGCVEKEVKPSDGDAKNVATVELTDSPLKNTVVVVAYEFREQIFAQVYTPEEAATISVKTVDIFDINCFF